MEEKQFFIRTIEEALKGIGAEEIHWGNNDALAKTAPKSPFDGEIAFFLPRFRIRLSYRCVIKAGSGPRFLDDSLEESSQPVLYAAPFISEDFGSLLESKNISFLDEEGNILLLSKRFYFSKRATKTNTTLRRSDISPFDGKAEKSSLILRTLLREPPRFLTVREIAKTAGASLGQISNVRAFLKQRNWIEESPHGFRLLDPVSLLKEWAPVYQKTKIQGRKAAFFTTKKSGDVLAALSSMKGSWYLASYSAAERYHPMVLNPVMSIYADPSSYEAIIKSVPASPVLSGPNLIIQEARPSELSFAEKREEAFLVSPVEVILSLEGTGGRSEEALAPLYNDLINGKERSRT
jgi:hypothetical protein